MSKFSTLFAAALLAVAGSASANTIPLISDTNAHVIDTATDTTSSYTIPTISEANGVLVSFDFTFDGTLQNNDFFAIFFGTSLDPNFGIKVNGGSPATTTNDVFGRMSGVGGTFVQNSNLVAGNNYTVAGWLSKSGNSSGNYDTLKVWLNPTGGELASLTGADVTVKGDTGFASLSTVGFRTTNIDNGASLNVSAINVAAVPEPASLALFGLAAAGMGAVRRRKKA